MKNDIKGSVRILSFLKNDIKVFSAIYGDNWQSLNILTTEETFAKNITSQPKVLTYLFAIRSFLSLSISSVYSLSTATLESF